MKNFTLLLALLLLAIAGMAQNYITLYSDCYYRGNASKLYPGRYELRSQNVGERQVSSIRVPRGMKVVVYDAPEPGQGDKTRFTEDVSCMPSQWNDRVMSVVVEEDNTGGGYSNEPYRGGSYEVVVYSDCNYRGNRRSLGLGNYNQGQFGVANDDISSIEIPDGWSVTVYQDGDFRGNTRTFTRSVSCFGSDWNDKISGLKISRNSGSSGGGYVSDGGYSNHNTPYDEITLYTDCYYRGDRSSLRPGRYNTRDLGIANDAISSMKVPSGFKVTVYMDGDFRGNRRDFYDDVSCFGNDWNDKISCVVIERIGSNPNQGGGSYNYNSNNNYTSSSQGVTFYANPWFKGDKVRYDAGRYNMDGNLDMKVSSISLESGYEVILYDDYGFRGSRYTLTYTSTDLKGIGWDDRIRSVEVRRK